jgi:hypothetical protein
LDEDSHTVQRLFESTAFRIRFFSNSRHNSARRRLRLPLSSRLRPPREVRLLAQANALAQLGKCKSS